MYNLRHLFKVARAGLSDMVPAVRAAFNRSHEDDKLDQVFGKRPRFRILGLSILCILAGEVFVLSTPNLGPNVFINWSALWVAVVFAVLFRRFFFETKKAEESDFPWLAATLIPAGVALVVISFIRKFTNDSVEFLNDAPEWAGASAILLSAVQSLGVAAALAISVAALCFSRNWGKAVGDLIGQLIVFKVMVMITIFVIIEISIVGRLLSALCEQFLGISFPQWIGDVADQITLSVLLLIAYLAVIGGVWIACKQSFGTLLEEGDVRIMKTLEDMSSAPSERKKKRALKKEEKRKKKEAEKKRKQAAKLAKSTDSNK